MLESDGDISGKQGVQLNTHQAVTVLCVCVCTRMCVYTCVSLFMSYGFLASTLFLLLCSNHIEWKSKEVLQLADA